MSIYRSYFLKNNTLISNNVTNNSQNPVTEISYGGFGEIITRFIFDIDFSNLQNRIQKGIINPQRIKKHILHMTNTISYAKEYVGKKSYSQSIDRASNFSLEIFNIKQNWDEGTGYDFIYTTDLSNNVKPQASNWYSATTLSQWENYGAYISGVSEIIGVQRFEKGNEDIHIDITDYVNQRLFGTGLTENVVYSGISYGLGIKYTNDFENLKTYNIQAVAFHAKNTNTWFEPYVETIIDDEISDDRNYFYLDKENDLYLYINVGGFPQDIVVNSVNIYDNEDKLIMTFTGDSVINVSKGVYKVSFFVNSNDYPDGIIFNDVWDLTINGKNSKYFGNFYLIDNSQYININRDNSLVLSNYHFNFWGIGEKEKIRAGNIRKIKINIKEFYPNQNKFIPLDIEYRLYTTIGDKWEIDIIPFTKVNRTNSGYEFDLDTSWLIPQDYYLQLRLRDGYYYEDKKPISFTIVSDNIL